MLTRLAISISAVTLAGVAACAALLFAIGAVYLELASVTTPALAALGTAGASLALAALCLLITQIGGRHTHHINRLLKQDAREQNEDQDLDALLAALIGGELEVILRKNARGAVLASLIAGVIVGISPSARKALSDLVKSFMK